MNQKSIERSAKFLGPWLKTNFERENLTGFVVAVSHKNKLVFSEAFGYSDISKKQPMKTDNIFRIASHSKTFTATAIMQLQEKGKLRIDDYAVDYIDWLKGHTDKRWQKVTIRQLLSHSAGVLRDGEDSDYWQLDTPFPDDSGLKEEILNSKLIVDNNIEHKYSNLGYGLLGIVVKNASGLTYNEYVTQHIVDALNLKATGPELSKEAEAKLVTGYSRPINGSKRLPIENINTQALSAATGFYSTAADICQYFSAHLIGSKKLLDDESKKEMQKLQFRCKTTGYDEEFYGLGFIINKSRQRTTFGHGGGFPGHITKTMVDPQDEIVVTVLSNCLDSPTTQIANGVLSALSFFKDNSEIKKSDLLKLEGRYENLWGLYEILATPTGLTAISPGYWYPFYDKDDLKQIDATTFKISSSSSYASDGELVKFKLKNDKVESINYSGSTILPEEKWTKEIAKQSSINLPK